MPELLIPKQGVSEEQLDELFQPGKQNWAWKYKADNEAIAKFTVGDRDYVWQAFNHFRDDKPHKWEIQFRVVKQSTDPEKLQVYGTTGTGNSAEVMSNAVDIMREFLQYYGDGVQQIAFDAKENSRIALYRKMIQRLLPNWNADEDYSSEYGLRFTLTRPKSMPQGSDLQEIATMPADQFAGGKDMLDYMPPPSKKRLRPLPGGTDLMYAIETMGPETRVQIVDPGMPGITRPVVVAVLNLDPSTLPNTVQVGSITVDEVYRGRGLARALYGIVLTIMRKNLVSGSGQTPGGRRNWLSLATIPGVEVQGLVRIPNQIFDLERTATVSPQWRKYADRTMDQIMELGGQFYSKDNNSTYWLFDVVPGKGSLQPAVKNALSRLYGYDSDNLLLATWSGA